MAQRKLKVFAIPDMHLPWVDWKSVEKIYKEIDNQGPDVVIQLGDLYDFLAYSRFARSHDIMSPKEEVEEARLGAVNFWKTVTNIVPRARKIQLRGNHDARLLMRTIDRFPEIHSLVEQADKDIMKFKGVQTMESHRDELEIEGVVYIHGYLTKLGDHCKYLLKPVVHGHSHRGGTVFYRIGGQTIWELDCGYLADQLQVPLQYGKTKTTLWTLGCGIIDKLGPRFVSLDKS